MQKILWLAVAGASGTLSRYLLAGIVHRFTPAGFPYGTITVNIVGCFVAGLIWAITENRVALSSETRIILLVGFMGAFTTFSTYMLETSELLRQSQYLASMSNILFHNFLGLAALYFGLALGRTWG